MSQAQIQTAPGELPLPEPCRADTRAWTTPPHVVLGDEHNELGASKLALASLCLRALSGELACLVSREDQVRNTVLKPHTVLNPIRILFFPLYLIHKFNAFPI